MSDGLTALGYALVMLGVLFTMFGVYAILWLNSFYARIVVTAKVEAMGFVTVVLGGMLLAGADVVSAKLLVILLFELLTVSVSAHAIARSAWRSGYHLTTAPEDVPDPTGEPS